MHSIWHNMPRRSFGLLLMAVFLTFLPMGLLIDISGLGSNSPVRLALIVAFSGLIAVGYVFSIRRQRRFLPFVIAAHVAFMVLSNRPPYIPAGAVADSALRGRLTFDAAAIGVSIVFAYTCFMLFFRREGARYFRAHAEIELAHTIHELLVPRIDTRIGRFEFCGASLPSGEVGGDLVDLVLVEERSIAHLPVAMFEGSRYSSAPLPCAAGDLYVLITDGITEVFDKADRQLGIEPIKETIRRHAERPLGELLDAIIATSRAHGEQTDDQTVLLVRRS